MEIVSLKGGCTGLSESTLVKMPHCWKSHVAAQIIIDFYEFGQYIKGTRHEYFISSDAVLFQVRLHRQANDY